MFLLWVLGVFVGFGGVEWGLVVLFWCGFRVVSCSLRTIVG